MFHPTNSSVKYLQYFDGILIAILRSWQNDAFFSQIDGKKQLATELLVRYNIKDQSTVNSKYFDFGYLVIRPHNK